MAEIAFHRIYWKQNSPYGTFVAGDDVIIYWDDVTEDLVVRNNGIVITSGDDIPFFFTYAGQTDTYYKTEYHYYPLICSLALEKIDTFRGISAFPYITIVRYPDYPSCAVAPVVCNISFDSLPVVVNASAASVADGQITVLATSSNGAIEYNIGSDFVYGEGQASGNFTGLAPGNYNVYARDAVNCFAEISVTVGIEYTYGPLLRIEYFDFIGNQSKVELLQKSYSGAVTEVDGSGYSCFTYTLRGEGEEDKFKPIISTESTLNLMNITDFQFDSLFTGDPEKYRVRFSKNLGSGYEVKLLHKFLPNQYSTEYKAPPYAASFVSVDGTATLKDIPFADGSGARLFGLYTQISIIAFCLKKLKLDLNIRCGINLYAETMDTTDSDDPLDQAYVDVDTYYLNEAKPTCEQVIKAILEPYGAQVIQWDNVWNILRVEERVNDFDYREFDLDGVYVSDGTYSPVKDVTGPSSTNSLNWVASPNMQLMPGYGLMKVNYRLGLDPNILVNGNFRLKLQYNWVTGTTGVVANTEGFQIVHNDANVDQVSYEVINANNIALKHFARSGIYIQSDNYTLKMSFSDLVKFKVNYKNSPVTRDYPYQKIKAIVRYGAYYLKSDGTWTTSANTIVYYSKDFGKYTDFEIIAGQPDATALDGLTINTKLYFSYVLDAEFTSLSALKAKSTTSLLIGTKTELLPSVSGSGVTTNFIYYLELENDTNSQSVPNIIRPDDYNSSTNPVQWILKKQVTSSTTEIDNNFYIDRIALEYLPEGKDAPEFFNAKIGAEANNPEIFEKELIHGSLTNDIDSHLQLGIEVLPLLFDNLFPGLAPTGDFLNGGGFISVVTTGTENADKIYNGYLRDSDGDGYVNWSRDNVAESRLLHDIYLRTLAGQYSRPWRKMFGTLVSGDTYFSLIDSIRETLDSNRLYYPISLSVDDKLNQMSGEFVELINVADESEGEGGSSGGSGSGSGTGAGSGMGFTLGFTIGFDS